MSTRLTATTRHATQRSARFAGLIAALAFITVSQRTARPQELHEGLPADTLGFVELDPSAANAGKSPQESALLDVGLEAMQSFGVLPREAAVVGDALGLASVAGKRKSCMALLDADFQVVGERGLACNSVQVVWIIETGGGATEAQAMVDRLTRALDHFSSRKTAQQQVRKTSEGKKEFVEFRDENWPAWLTLAWTQQGKDFILTLGDGAMEHYLADHVVGGVPWIETVKAVDAEANRLGNRGKILGRAYMSAKTFRERYPKPMSRTILGRCFATMDLSTADAALLTARAEERVISLDHATAAVGALHVEPWTTTLKKDSPLLRLVPAEATSYLAVHVNWNKIYDRVTALSDAVLNEPEGGIDRDVAEFARRQGVNVRKDILDRLAPVVIVHDAPRHPLKLPLMLTFAGAGDNIVQSSMNKMLVAAATALEGKSRVVKRVEETSRGKIAAEDFTRFRLRTDKDGVMYMQLGLVGPAWAWVDQRWVFSWSPIAVRYNLPLLKEVTTDAFSRAVPLPAETLR